MSRRTATFWRILWSLFVFCFTSVRAVELQCEFVERISCLDADRNGFNDCWSCLLNDTVLLENEAEIHINIARNEKTNLDVRMVQFKGGSVDFLPLLALKQNFPNMDNLFMHKTTTKVIDANLLSTADFIIDFGFKESVGEVEVKSGAFKEAINLRSLWFAHNDLKI